MRVGHQAKRVLFVDHTPFIGGAELVLASHIEHLDRRQFTPLVACTDTVPSLVDRYRRAGAEVYIVPMERLRERSPRVIARLLHASWMLRRVINRESVDLVVSNTSRAAYVASLAVMGTDVPLIWWVRDFLFGDRMFAVLRRVPGALIGVSDAVRCHYRGEDDERFHVINVGSDLHSRLESVTDEAISEERARLGMAVGDPVVGFMGRLVDEKGPQDLLEAMIRVRGDFPAARLLYVGTGEGQAGNVEPLLRNLVRERGYDFVTFAGYQSDEALYFRLFDIFVLSTRTVDAYATSVVQAMMAGTPVVATDAGGTRELVRNGVTGILVPPRDPEGIARGIIELLRNPAAAESLSGAAKRYVMENNREDVITGRAQRVYQQALGLERR